MIEKYYANVCDDVDFSVLEDIPLAQIDVNSILYEIFNCINIKVFSYIKEGDNLPDDKREEIIEACDQKIDEFSPYLNSLDSWFCNEIDDVSINGSIEEIADSVYKLLLQNI